MCACACLSLFGQELRYARVCGCTLVQLHSQLGYQAAFGRSRPGARGPQHTQPPRKETDALTEETAARTRLVHYPRARGTPALNQAQAQAQARKHKPTNTSTNTLSCVSVRNAQQSTSCCQCRAKGKNTHVNLYVAKRRIGSHHGTQEILKSLLCNKVRQLVCYRTMYNTKQQSVAQCPSLQSCCSRV